MQSKRHSLFSTLIDLHLSVGSLLSPYLSGPCPKEIDNNNKQVTVQCYFLSTWGQYLQIFILNLDICLQLNDFIHTFSGIAFECTIKSVGYCISGNNVLSAKTLNPHIFQCSTISKHSKISENQRLILLSYILSFYGPGFLTENEASFWYCVTHLVQKL